MTRVALHLSDPNQRLMLRAMLERADCEIVEERPDVSIHENFEEAIVASVDAPSLVVTTMEDVPRAVQAMARGVWGYILLPFQPDEAGLKVARAVHTGQLTPFEPRPLSEVENEHILAVLRHCNGNRSQAAQLLGIGRNTLWRKLDVIEHGSGGGPEKSSDSDDRT